MAFAKLKFLLQVKVTFNFGKMACEVFIYVYTHSKAHLYYNHLKGMLFFLPIFVNFLGPVWIIISASLHINLLV